MIYLVRGLEHLDYFPYIGNVIIPTDFHIFQRGRYTTNQILSLWVVEPPHFGDRNPQTFHVPLRRPPKSVPSTGAESSVHLSAEN